MAANRAASASSLLNNEVAFGSALVNRLKREAKKAHPRFRPFKLPDETEWFILLFGQQEFDELKNDLDIKTANRIDFRLTSDRYSDPLFLNNDLLYNGCVLRPIAG